MSNTNNNGDPKTAVTAPTGNSIPPKARCATKSAPTSNIPPINALNPSDFRKSGPTKLRAICGATNPINPIIPALPTIAPTATDPTNNC